MATTTKSPSLSVALGLWVWHSGLVCLAPQDNCIRIFNKESVLGETNSNIEGLVLVRGKTDSMDFKQRFGSL